MNQLVKAGRIQKNRNELASRAAVDSQSVRKGIFCSLDTDIDGGKFVNAGLPVRTKTSSDRWQFSFAFGCPCFSSQPARWPASIELLWKAHEVCDNLKLICAHHAYHGSFEQAASYCRFGVGITQKPPSSQAFIPQRGLWQVERSFAWLNRYRRLSRDYEKLARSAEAFIQMAFCDLILAKIWTEKAKHTLNKSNLLANWWVFFNYSTFIIAVRCPMPFSLKGSIEK